MFVHCCCGRFLLILGAYKSCSSVHGKALVVSKIFHMPQGLLLPANVAVKQCWSISQFLCLFVYPRFCPWLCALLGRAQQGCAPACSKEQRPWGLRALTSGVSTPLSSALSSVIRSVFFRSRGEFYSQQFLLRHNFTAFLLFRYVCVHTDLKICFVFVFLHTY